MRSYVGERPTSGPAVVWVDENAERPPLSEISDLLGDLPGAFDAARRAPEWPERRDAWMSRKEDLIARIEAAENPVRRKLAHVTVSSPDGFDWGYRGNGPADLAHAILSDHLGEPPTTPIRLAFRDEVIAELPSEGFRLPAGRVGAWVATNRDLIDQEMFLAPPIEGPTRGDGVALSVLDTDDGEPAVAGPTDDPAAASTLIAACEAAWTDIQSHHPDLPDAVMVLGTGVERGRLVKLGHWWGGQWVADGQTRGEVLLAGEALHLEPKQVFEVLLHEAAHGINAGRGVKDTSRGGRYHNQKFAATAKEVLLRVRAMPPYGLAATDLTTEASERYANTIEHLGDAMRIARQLGRGIQVGADEGAGIEGSIGGERGGAEGAGGAKGSSPPAVCGCGRRMRMAPSTLAAGPVVCGLCGSEFTTGAERSPQNDADRADPDARPASGTPSEAVVNRTFLARRQASIAGELPAEPERGVDAAVSRILERRRAQIEGLLEVAQEQGAPVANLLKDRHERLSRALRAGIAATLGETVEPDVPTEDHEVLARWYERFGTLDEQPMPAASAAEAARRDRQARSLLQADGLLHGPEIADTAGRPFQAGDRVVPIADQPRLDLPAGTPGTVESVDPDTGTLDIDFATWGRLRAHLNEAVTSSLRHDYTEVRPQATPELDLGIDR